MEGMNNVGIGPWTRKKIETMLDGNAYFRGLLKNIERMIIVEAN